MSDFKRRIILHNYTNQRLKGIIIMSKKIHYVKLTQGQFTALCSALRGENPSLMFMATHDPYGKYIDGSYIFNISMLNLAKFNVLGEIGRLCCQINIRGVSCDENGTPCDENAMPLLAEGMAFSDLITI